MRCNRPSFFPVKLGQAPGVSCSAGQILVCSTATGNGVREAMSYQSSGDSELMPVPLMHTGRHLFLRTAAGAQWSRQGRWIVLVVVRGARREEVCCRD